MAGLKLLQCWPGGSSVTWLSLHSARMCKMSRRRVSSMPKVAKTADHAKWKPWIIKHDSKTKANGFNMIQTGFNPSQRQSHLTTVTVESPSQRHLKNNSQVHIGEFSPLRAGICTTLTCAPSMTTLHGIPPAHLGTWRRWSKFPWFGRPGAGRTWPCRWSCHAPKSRDDVVLRPVVFFADHGDPTCEKIRNIPQYPEIAERFWWC